MKMGECIKASIQNIVISDWNAIAVREGALQCGFWTEVESKFIPLLDRIAVMLWRDTL